MTRKEIEKLPFNIDMLISESLLVDTKEQVHKKITEVCSLAIKALEQEPCDNCDYKEWLKGEIEQEPCEDCISRKAVLDGINQYIDKAQSSGVIDAFISFETLVVKELPSIQPKPKTGHWKKLNVGYGCSECSLATNKSGVDFYRFCPNCGAKMESEE